MRLKLTLKMNEAKGLRGQHPTCHEGEFNIVLSFIQNILVLSVKRLKTDMLNL